MWLTLFLAALLLSKQTVIGVTVDNPFPNPGDTVSITVCACLMPQAWNDSLELSIDGPDAQHLPCRSAIRRSTHHHRVDGSER